MAIMTSEEWEVVSRAVALQVAHERIVGTDRTLPVKIETVRAAKDAELKRAIEAEVVDGKLLAEEMKRLVGEVALLTIALYFAQGNRDQMLKDKPRLYVALHGLLTFSRTFRAAAYARWAELLPWGRPVLSAAERARAVEVIERADLPPAIC
jgi:hypothetical protein